MTQLNKNIPLGKWHLRQNNAVSYETLSYIPGKVSGSWSYVWFLKLQLRTSQWRMILFNYRYTWEGERAAWGTKQLDLLKVELLSLLVKPHWLWPITIYINKKTFHLQEVLTKLAYCENDWEQLKYLSIKIHINTHLAFNNVSLWDEYSMAL